MLTLEQTRAAERFAMPKVSVSEWVEWFPSVFETKEPVPAFVAKVNERNVVLKTFPLHSNVPKTYHGVRHIDDPSAGDTDLHKDGVWRKQAQVRNIDQAEARIKSLEESLKQVLERQGILEESHDELKEEVNKRLEKIDG